MKKLLLQVGQTASIELEGAQTIIIGSKGDGLDGWNGESSANYVIELRLIGEVAVYRRVFALPIYQCVEIGCGAYSEAQVQWTGVTAGADLPALQVTYRAGMPNPTRRELVTLPQSFPTAAQRPVPPGARRLFVATADAAFQWVGSSPAAVSIVEAMAVAQAVDVKGPRFLPSVSPWLGIWEIEL